jgi:type I site-specific restriction-modification system R (restriction) subunit
VVLVRDLRAALARLNPDLPESASKQAVEKLTRVDFSRSLVQHNREYYGYIRGGVPVEWRDIKGETHHARAQVIDFRTAANNRFLAVRELKIQGVRVPHYNRRADLVCFVNGLPLVFIELKAVYRNIRAGFDDNLTDYLHEHSIAHAFHHNAFLIVSNGDRARYGSITFKRSEEDQSTVKLVYENRGEKLGIARLDLNDRIAAKIEEADLDPDQVALLEKLLGKDYEVITADDRLDKLADDFVEYCSTSLETGKSMRVCIDKITCARMLQRIEPRWQLKLAQVKALMTQQETALAMASNEYARERLATSLEKLCGQAHKKYQEIIADYNREKDRVTVEETFTRLVEFVHSLDAEQRRAAEEGLSDDEYALFQMLFKDNISRTDRNKLKQASQSLLASLRELLTPMYDWTKNTSTQAEVKVFILDNLWQNLPRPPFTEQETETLASRVYDYVWQRSASGDAVLAA